MIGHDARQRQRRHVERDGIGKRVAARRDRREEIVAGHDVLEAVRVEHRVDQPFVGVQQDQQLQVQRRAREHHREARRISQPFAAPALDHRGRCQQREADPAGELIHHRQPRRKRTEADAQHRRLAHREQRRRADGRGGGRAQQAEDDPEHQRCQRGDEHGSARRKRAVAPRLERDAVHLHAERTPIARARHERVRRDDRQRQAARAARAFWDGDRDVLELVRRRPRRQRRPIGQDRDDGQRRGVAACAAYANRGVPRHVAFEPRQRKLRTLGGPREGQLPLPLAVVEAVKQSRPVVRHLHDQAGVEAVEEDHGRGAREGAEQAASERGADVSPHAEARSAPATER